MDFEKLKKPFRVHEVEWRIGSTNKDKTKGIALCYMDARAVMDRLDSVAGPQNWQCRYPHANGKTCCEIGIKVNDEWVWKSDGAGDTNFEREKGAFSDAFKRAAVRWGIGRYLYELDAPWVTLKDGKYIDPEDLHKLKKKYAQFIWRGPLGVMSLKEACKKLGQDLESATTTEQAREIVNMNEAIIEQMIEDLPSYWYGDGGDLVGYKALVEEKLGEEYGL